MGKRKRSKSREDRNLRKEIEKLKKKLSKRRRTESSTSSSAMSEQPPERPNTPVLDTVMLDENVDMLSPMHGEADEAVVEKRNMESDIQALDPELLQVLGEDPTDAENIHGEDLHQHILPRWKHILQKGLDKEVRTELCKRYLPPQNCINIRAPKLNPMVQHFLTDINKKKEMFSEHKQNQLSSCLAALGQALNQILSSKENQIDLIKPLSDAGRLLCDFHHRESLSRRYSIINVVNRDLRDTLRNTNIDEYLFGTDLADQLKSHKEITKAASDLKTPRPVYKPRTAVPAQRGALNYRGALGATSTPRAYPSQRQQPTNRPGPGSGPRPRDRDHRRYESSSSRKSSGRGRGARRY